MRTKLAPLAIAVLLLAAVGCGRVPTVTPANQARSTTPAATATSSAPSPTAVATQAAAATVTSAPASSSETSTAASAKSDPATAAIQAVIQKANQEQVDAFTKSDPTAMRDTATSGYYNELVQINDDMANNGVSAIKLVKLEWGPITLNGTTGAQATTYETWQTNYSDGTTDQSRDRNVYTLVQQQGAWKIQADDHPDSGLDQASGSTNPSPGISLPTAPTSPAPGIAVPSGSTSGITPPSLPSVLGRTDVSHNWSGYAATGSNITAVTGTWTVPQSQGSGSFASGATWVGVGGVTSRDLIQAGTEDTTNGTGRVRYDAWIEMLPQSSHPVPLAVSPGDSVTVSISQQGTNSWLIAFKNNTTGQTYQTTVRYNSSLSSAEWVEEAPSAGRGVVPLDDFGTVQFSGGTAIENGKTLTIAQIGAKPIMMIGSRGTALATPSGLNADGKGFSVSRTNASTTQPSVGRGASPVGFPGFPVK